MAGKFLQPAQCRKTTILLAVALILLGLGVGACLPLSRPEWQIRSGALLKFNLSDLWLIAGRNLRIGLQLLLGALTFGLYGSIQLFQIGLAFGLTLANGRAAGLPSSTIALVLLPHTVFEFAGFVLLGAVEFEAARWAYHKLRYDSAPEIRPLAGDLARQLLLGFGLIVIGAIVETTFTLALSKRLL